MCFKRSGSYSIIGSQNWTRLSRSSSHKSWGTCILLINFSNFPTDLCNTPLSSATLLDTCWLEQNSQFELFYPELWVSLALKIRAEPFTLNFSTSSRTDGLRNDFHYLIPFIKYVHNFCKLYNSFRIWSKFLNITIHTKLLPKCIKEISENHRGRYLTYSVVEKYQN